MIPLLFPEVLRRALGRSPANKRHHLSSYQPPTFEFRGFRPHEVERFHDEISSLRCSNCELRVGFYRDVIMTRVTLGHDGRPIGGLFTSDFRPVEEATTVRRGEGLVIGRWPGPDSVSEPEVIEEGIYGGVLFGGFGHVILESACRLWAAKDYPDLPIVLQTMPKTEVGRSAFLALAQLLGIATKRFRFFTTPVRIRRAVVPQPGLSLGSELNEQYLAFIRANLSCPPSRKRSRRIFLSRSALGWRQRKAVGEEHLDAALKSAGVEVLHPEAVALRNQIAAFNEASTVAGFIGSQFHTLFLRTSPEPIDLLYLCSARPNPNFFQVDMLFPGRRLYCNVAEYDPLFEFGNRAPFHFSADNVRQCFGEMDIKLPPLGDRRAVDFVYDWAVAYFYFKVFRQGVASGEFKRVASQRIQDMVAKSTRSFSNAETEQVMRAYYEVARNYQLSDNADVVAVGQTLLALSGNTDTQPVQS